MVWKEECLLTLETLAWLVRKGIGDDDPDLMDTAARHLLTRSRPIAESASKVLRPEDRKDVHSDAIRHMFRSLQSATGEEPTFWEQRFGLTLKQSCIDAVRKHRKKLHKATDSIHDMPEDASSAEEGDLAAEVAERIDRETLQRIISELPPQEARAVNLAWIERRKISGPDSVSEIMDISPSMVHRHLRNARRRLKKIPRFRTLLDL